MSNLFVNVVNYKKNKQFPSKRTFVNNEWCGGGVDKARVMYMCVYVADDCVL